MSSTLEPGAVFPDIGLPDHVGNPRRLSQLAAEDVLTLAGPAPTGVDEGRATWRGVLDEACSLVFVLTHTARSERRPEVA